MKKTPLYILSSIILILGSCNSSNTDQSKFMGLNGNIESIMEKRYKAEEKFGNAIQDTNVDNAIEYIFDNNGNLIKQIGYSGDGDPDYYLSNEYDGNNILIESNSYYVYSKEGDRMFETTTSLINKDGNRYTYSRNRMGLDSEIEKDTIIEIHEGKHITQTENRGGVLYRTDKILDDSERVIEQKTISTDDNKLTNHMIYTFKDGVLTQIIEKLPMNPDKEQIVYDFVYNEKDKRQNWTKLTSKKDGITDYIVERTIKYRD